MSVVKYDTNTQRATKGTVWGLERVSKWFIRGIYDVLLFFTILIIASYYIDLSNYFNYFLVVFITYIVSDIVVFILAYVTIKFIFGLAHREVKTFMATIKYKKRKRRLWVYIFTIVFETIFYLLSVVMILANELPWSDFWSLVIAWILIGFTAKGLGNLIYFIFYTF